MKRQDLSEGFAVETKEGLIFTVKGLLHPPDRVIAYLRYFPDPEGDRKRNDILYRRVYGFEEQQKILESRFPVYLKEDPVLGIRVQAVPRELMRRIYDPCRELKALQSRGTGNLVEEKTIAFARLLMQTGHAPSENIGVSGSVMLGLHNSESDIDLMVYGEMESKRIYQALQRLLDDPSKPVRRPVGKELKKLHDSHKKDTPLSFVDFNRLQLRKANEGYFEETQYFIRFVKRLDQQVEKYGDPSFEFLGSATIRARIKDDRDAIFTPCRYVVEEVMVREGKAAPHIREVISFRGRFSDQARTGELVLARGSLERVIPRAAPIYHRLNVGGRPGDYLLSLDQPEMAPEVFSSSSI